LGGNDDILAEPPTSQPLPSTSTNTTISTHPTDSKSSQQHQPLKTSPLFGYVAPQQYRKQQGVGSWQMRDSYGGSEDKGLGLGLPAPQRLIPKSDKSIPLAKRHCLMIEQCAWNFPFFHSFEFQLQNIDIYNFIINSAVYKYDF